MTMRDQLIRAVEEAQEALRLWDIAQTPLPHAPDCACPLWECLQRRLDALPPLDLTTEEAQAFQEAWQAFEEEIA